MKTDARIIKQPRWIAILREACAAEREHRPMRRVDLVGDR